MLTNDIKEGTPLRLTGGRRGKMFDNKRGIARVVEVIVTGQGTDVGSTYIDEIVFAFIKDEWVTVELTESHRKKLKSIRAQGW